MRAFVKIAAIGAGFSLLPTLAFAHTRWFAEGVLPPYVTTEPTAVYVAIWAIITVVIVAIGIALEKKRLLQLDFLRPRASHSYERAASIFSMVTGAFLMIAGTHEYLFSPNISVDSGIPVTVIMLQFLLGLSFLVGAFARVSAIGLMFLWFIGLSYAGWIAMLEDVWVLSTALFILIMGNDYFSITKIRVLAHITRRYHSYALPLLRVGAGVTLLTLGFTEKIMHPEFGMNFLQQYDWNFMQMSGMSYTDYLFVISAGAVEAILGLVFILGIMTRLNALVLGIFFTIPLFLLGPIELSGHVPHFAAVILVLLFGAGDHFKLIRRRK